jgi:hypothetical protein
LLLFFGLDVFVSGNLSSKEYPNIAEKADDRSIPLLYGALYAVGGAVACPRVDTDYCILAGHHCNALIGDVYEEDGTPVAGYFFLDNADDGRHIFYALQCPTLFMPMSRGKPAFPGADRNSIETIIDIFGHVGMNYSK